VKPDHLAVSRVQERRAQTVEVELAGRQAARIAFALGQDVLRPERELLRLDYSDDPPVEHQRIVSGPVGRRKFSDCVLWARRQFQIGLEWNDLPTQAAKLGINSASPRSPFQLFAQRLVCHILTLARPVKQLTASRHIVTETTISCRNFLNRCSTYQQLKQPEREKPPVAAVAIAAQSGLSTLC
jgi:hypothetical protein